MLKPYGVWGVITPFNFPLALAGGPVAAALVTGNCVVLKGATDTPWAGRLLADCIRDADDVGRAVAAAKAAFPAWRATPPAELIRLAKKSAALLE